MAATEEEMRIEAMRLAVAAGTPWDADQIYAFFKGTPFVNPCAAEDQPSRSEAAPGDSEGMFLRYLDAMRALIERSVTIGLRLKKINDALFGPVEETSEKAVEFPDATIKALENLGHAPRSRQLNVLMRVHADVLDAVNREVDRQSPLG